MKDIKTTIENIETLLNMLQDEVRELTAHTVKETQPAGGAENAMVRAFKNSTAYTDNRKSVRGNFDAVIDALLLFKHTNTSEYFSARRVQESDVSNAKVLQVHTTTVYYYFKVLADNGCLITATRKGRLLLYSFI